MYDLYLIAIKVVAGVMDINEATSGLGEQHKNASKLIIHPDFDASFNSDDICMIKVIFKTRLAGLAAMKLIFCCPKTILSA